MNIPITWASSSHIIYIPFLIIAIATIIWAFTKRTAMINALIAQQWQKQLIMHYSKARLFLKSVLLILGFITLFLALLQPQWGNTEEIVKQDGRDILVCFDISRSMLAQDCEPSRLECAKEKIKTLLHSLPCERFGLILFAGSAFVQCPLTADYGAFSMFLNQVDAHTISNGSTFIAQALNKALDVYKRFPAKKTKLILLCTDGEDFSPNVESLKEQLRNEGIIIITYGIGTVQGAPIPILDNDGNAQGHQKDEHNAIVISKLNEPMLKALAHDIGGYYVPLQKNNTDIQAMNSYIRQFEKEQGEEKSVSKLQEQYPWFVAFSFICFLLEWIL